MKRRAKIDTAQALAIGYFALCRQKGRRPDPTSTVNMSTAQIIHFYTRLILKEEGEGAGFFGPNLPTGFTVPPGQEQWTFTPGQEYPPTHLELMADGQLIKRKRPAPKRDAKGRFTR